MKERSSEAPFLEKILHPQASLNHEIIYKEYFMSLGLDFPSERIFYDQED